LAGIIRGLTDLMTRSAVHATRGDAEAVHAARVAGRRLREALAVVAGPSRRDAAALRETVLRLRRGLGPVREVDVLLTLLDRCAKRYRWPVMGVARVRSLLLERRRRLERSTVRLVTRVDLTRVIARSARITSHLSRGRHAEKSRTRLRLRARSRAGDVVRALRAAGPFYAPETFHQARIAAKKLRYVLELSERLDGVVHPADIGALRAAQDTLGRLHDLQELQSAVDAAAAEHPTDARVRRALATMATHLAADSRRVHAAFLPVKPRVAAAAERAAETLSWARRAGKV
jgi:CHAD domain-containing protein